MPNWIPVLIVLLTQGASGTMAATHPHDMMRMLRMVAQWEESTQEIRTNVPATVSSSKLSVRPKARRSGNQPEVVESTFTQFWPNSDLSRDGPAV